MRAPQRTPAAVVLALAAALTLTGCSPELPEPQPAAPPAVPPPATTLEQTDRILQSVATVLASGDAALSAAELAPRVTGPALAIRTAEYTLAAAFPDAQPLTPLPVQPQALVVPSTEGWPRTQIVVTEQPDDLSSPRLLVLRQEAPRAPYALWGWARLLPGAQMPATSAPSIGSPPLPPDAPGLVATPADVVAQYADVLTNWDASQYVGSFASPDRLRDEIAPARDQNLKNAADTGGTYTQAYTAVPDQVFAQATADGGALVVGGLTGSSTLTFSAASITVPPELAAVSGGAMPQGAVLRNNLTVDYVDVVAFYVPPATAGGPVQLLGAEQIYTSATGS